MPSTAAPAAAAWRASPGPSCARPTPATPPRSPRSTPPSPPARASSSARSARTTSSPPSWVAAADGLPVGVKGAGHGTTADPTAPVLISTRRLDAVAVDPRARTARVGAGATWAQVVAAAAPHGLRALCASSTAVGVAGYTLGGGMGPLGRRHGFAADHVRRLRLVTADGRPHEIDADRAPELFWALRGAGARGFGVVTELEFALFPIARLYGGGLFLPGAAAAELLHPWRQWAPTLPDEAGTSVALLRPARADAALPRAAARADGGPPAFHRRRRRAPRRGRGAPRPAARGRRTAARRRPRAPAHRRSTPCTASRPHPTPVHDGGAALRELPAEAVDALLAAAGVGRRPSPLRPGGAAVTGRRAGAAGGGAQRRRRRGRGVPVWLRCPCAGRLTAAGPRLR